MVGRRPVRGGFEVVLVLQFDPNDEMPVSGVKVIRLSTQEADSIGRQLIEASRGGC